MEARNIAFYKFINIESPETLCEALLAKTRDLKVLGTLLIASEGLNGMLAGQNESILEFQKYLTNDSRFNDIHFKTSFSNEIPFKRLRVKVKEEILTLNLPTIKPTNEKAPYVTAKELKALLDSKEDLTLIDVRNDFEVGHGTFEGALNPKTKSFSEFPDFVQNLNVSKDQKIVTFCTGGIRCEKGALILKQLGFENVFQLEGGILEYFAQNPGDTHFKGKCFVFDERELLDKNLSRAL